MAHLSHSDTPMSVPADAKELTDQAKIYSARMRLQNSIDQADALDAIREIAGNLIGTEQVAVFKVDQRRSEFWLYWSFGIDPNKHVLLDVRNEPQLHKVLKGTAVFRERRGQNLLSTEEPVNAIVPILVEGAVAAIVVFFRLITHKPALEPVDHQICEVLSNSAARAVTPYQQK